MEAIENLINKEDENSQKTISAYKDFLDKSYKKLDCLYIVEQHRENNYSYMPRIKIMHDYNIKYKQVKHRIEGKDDYYVERSYYNFDDVQYKTNNNIDKMLINCQLLYWLTDIDYNIKKIGLFIEDFNTLGIFGVAKIEGDKILYSNSPVITSVINETKDDTIIKMIAKFTNVIATNDDKIGIIKKLSGMIDTKSKNMQSNNIFSVICDKYKKSLKKILVPYDNFDFIINETKINHPDKNNQELTNQDLNITFDLGLSVLRYLENLNNL